MKRISFFIVPLLALALLVSCVEKKQELSQQELQQMLDEAAKKGADEAKKQLETEARLADAEARLAKAEKKLAEKEADEKIVTAGATIESLMLTGFIGGGKDATFVYDGLSDSGTATFTAYGAFNERIIRMGSYDPATGRLVMREYFTNGQYIGDFVGTLKNGVYSGVFTNKKTGGKVDFKLKQ